GPFGHRWKRKQRLGIGLSSAVITESGKIDAIGAETRRHRHEHRVGIGESAEQERAAFAETRARIMPDRHDTPDIGLERVADRRARQPRKQLHGHVLRSVTKPECISAEMQRAAARASRSCGQRWCSAWCSARYSRMARLSQATPV